MHRRSYGLFAIACVWLVVAVPVMAQPLRISGSSERGIFVGSEPIRLAYTLVISQGTAIVREDILNADVSPFTRVSATIGEKIPIPNDKEHFLIQASLTIRARPDMALGKHSVPALQVRYGFNEITGEGLAIERNRREASVTAKPIALEKVSIFVETDLLHEVSQIGDELTGSLTVYAGDGVLVLNAREPEEPSEDVLYLDSLTLKEPLKLRGIEPSVHLYDDYSLYSYRYRFQIMDMSGKPFSFPFPSVHWQREGLGEGIQTIELKPGEVLMRSILTKDSTFEPPKGLTVDPPWELYAFWYAPLATSISLGTGLGLYGFISLVGFLRTLRRRKSDADLSAPEISRLPALVYEQRLYHRHRLSRLARTAEKNKGADRESTERLRNAAARYVASCARERMSREEACAATHGRLAGLKFRTDVGHWLSLIREADENLAADEYGVTKAPERGSTVAGGSS